VNLVNSWLDFILLIFIYFTATKRARFCVLAVHVELLIVSIFYE